MSTQETKLVGVTIPLAQYNAIVAKLKPLETVQDFIREAIDFYFQEQEEAKEA